MPYMVKEIFKSLQGEGFHAGRAAVFCRMSGCDLWSGREADRAKAACSFCDTDFVGTGGTGGGRYESAADMAAAMAACWGEDRRERFAVITGGEPLLQLDEALVAALHAEGFRVAVETNGMREPPPGLDWICVSPKAGTNWTLKAGDELKLIYPQKGIDPAALTRLPFRHFILQPMDGPELAGNMAAAAEYCLGHPPWRLGLQQHKIVGIR